MASGDNLERAAICKSVPDFSQASTKIATVHICKPDHLRCSLDNNLMGLLSRKKERAASIILILAATAVHDI